MVRIGFPRRATRPAIAALALAAAIFAASAATALAAAPPDIRATWSAAACITGTLAQCEAEPQFPQLLVIETENFATGEISGQGESTSHAHVYSLTGTIVGCTVTIKTSQPGYTSESVQTLSANGKKLQGTFSDSFGRVSQPTFATRESGPGCNETEAERIARETAEKGKHPTGTQVICNYEFATSLNTCVASVGDGAATPTTPTGTVSFTTTSGGFASGAQCSLQVVSSSPSVASCQLVYYTSYSGLPSITASYGGDSTHAPSSGKTQLLGAGPEETVPGEVPGKAGEYPNEVMVETQVPAKGTEVEVSLEGKQSPPVALPMKLPKPNAALNQTSTDDLLEAESFAALVDLTAGQEQAKVAELGQALDRLDERANALLASPSAAQQAEGQKLLQQTTEAMQAISKMLQLQGEAAKAASNGGGPLGASEKELEGLITKAQGGLQSTSTAEQVKAQTELERAQKTLEALTKAVQKQGEISKEALKGIKASVAARRGVKVRTRTVRPLGRLLLRGAAAGRLVLRVRLTRSALATIAHGHSSLQVLLHLNMRLPSARVRGGVPRAFVRPVVLKRAPGHAKKR